MRFGRLACALGVGFSLSACAADDGQRLDAEAVVIGADGAPLAEARVDAYVVYFQVAGGPEIERRFADDVTEPPGIRTDAEGRFEVAASHLALSYDWERDEYVCEDVCTAWQTSCTPVTETVCVEQCEDVTYEDCWDECWDECETVCYDETVCDEDGNCWTETTCDDVCTPVCDTVCGTVTETQCYDDCWEETYDQCEDVCLELVEECGWVTRVYTSYPELSEIVSARSEIFLRDAEGQGRAVPGEALESRQEQRCEDDRCEPVNVWVQRDRFVVPFAP